MLGLLAIAAKAGLYVGALGAAGLAVHTSLLNADYRKWIIAFTLLLAAAVTCRLVLLNAELAGGLEHISDFSMFGWVWAPNQNQVLAYGSGVIALLSGLILHHRALLPVGAALVFAGAGLGGHTQGMEAPGINPFLVSVHVAIAAFWITAPLVLWPRTAISDDVLHMRLQRFSRIALWCVPVLFASGLWLAWRLAGSVETLTSQAYGQLLLLKLVLASAALGLGAFNRFRVTGQVTAQAARARALLRRTLILDSLLFAGIVLAIAAATTLTGPSA